MIAPRPTSLLFLFAAALALPLSVVAAAEEPVASSSVPVEQGAAAPMGGMGMQMRHGMGHGGMGGEHCPMRKGGMQGGDAPCMMGSHNACQMGGGDDLADKRLGMLEKRMDMMQMMLETLMKQQRPAPRAR